MAGCTVRRVTELTQRGRRRPNTGRAALIAVAVTAVVAGAGALAYVIGWGIADDKAPAAAGPTVSVEQQLECTTIKREYDAWRKADGLGELDRLRKLSASYATKKALNDGEAFAKAVTGYRDEPSMVLAVAVGTYNVEVSMLNLQAAATNDYEDAKYQDAMAAQGEVNTAFNNFWAKTCS